MKHLCFLVLLSLALLFSQCGTSFADPSSLKRALDVIGSTEPRPQYNIRPDPYRYAQIMKQNGRLTELGLTFEEGVAFAKAALARQGVKFSPPASSATRPLASLSAEVAPSGPIQKAAEFDPVVGVIISYPSNYAPWYPTFDGILAALDGDPKISVYLLCVDDADESWTRARIGAIGLIGSNFKYLQVPASSWTRDFGPMFIDFQGSGVHSEGMVDLYYYASADDDAVPSKLANAWNIKNFPLDLEYEGGNFMTDGAGTCFATTALYTHNDVKYTPTTLAEVMQTYLGCTKLVQVSPMTYELTRHIDIFAKLLDRTTILVGQCAPGDWNYDLLEGVAQQLSSVTNSEGKPFNVIRIPMPKPYSVNDPVWGQLTVFQTYTNSVILNKKVLVPIYGIAEDNAALSVYKNFFEPKGVEVVGIDSQEIIKLGGAVHCVTMERAAQAGPTVPGASSTFLTSSANPSVYGQSVTFMATVTPAGAGSGTPTGALAFKEGSTSLGTVTLNSNGKASLATSTLSRASHSITAAYGGDSNFTGSISNTVNQSVRSATSTALRSSVKRSVKGQSVLFTATVKPTGKGLGKPTGIIAFKDGSTTLGTATLNGSGAASFATSSLSTASHSITAAYGGDSNFMASTSKTFIQAVNKSATKAALISSVNPSVKGQSVTFTATVSPSGAGSGMPTGAVAFKIGSTTLGTGTLNKSGIATFATSALSRTSQSIKAVYGGDTDFKSSTSKTLIQRITGF